MPRRQLYNQLSRTELEMRDLGLAPHHWRVGPTFLLSLALTNVAATTLTLLAQ